DEYQKYAKPLLETGHLAIDVQMELNKGVTDDDEQGAYKDILQASPEEKQKLLEDKAYQDQVLGFLSDDERAVALNILKQGEERVEDKIRGQMLGAGTGEEEIKEALSKLTPEQKEQLRSDYARKYGADLTSDLMDELGGKDMKDADHALHRTGTAREEFNSARDEYYQSRDGIGKAWVDSVWDG